MKRSLLSAVRRHQHGFTLVELMVALALGLFLAGVVSWTYLQTASGARFGALESQMNEEGALALDLVRSHLRLVGYSEVDGNGKRIFKESPLLGCDGGFTQATASDGFDSLACQGGSGNDAIALRYQATAVNAFMVGSPQKPANCANAGIDPTIGAASIADNRFYLAADATNDNVPTLFCRGGDGLNSFSGEVALVPNVERMQLRYAITRTPVVGEVPPHQVTAIMASADLPGKDWTRVAAVEVCLVMRSAQPVPRGGLTMDEVTRHFDCEGQEKTATDGRLRRTYRTMVPLPNVRPALPKPYQVDAGGVVMNPYADLNGAP
ncbi:MAG TPA: PilW family protein [Hydrogenophaga sp.]|uniref:PilW family protein n=1 Tax=Hydrogenophaga sp. TaxID=1904254 RepID=UPI002CE48080|nr:PilW family protein [Hydrogenophaga sp.]HSX95347.1 PilW family protein [Hydrogenophaga sp.]